ncbi:recombinase family protein [Pseudarthrobacter sp. ATCC 49987]|uniref:recombinase family protein n=1 Tax=Pseudarthrobacter sp. ATCC 49987 TaxID=2698204 RepID=UPI00136971A6|nr:recombinase family protein [Pseudarthrobacter sp. ATCC 49987]
MQSAKTLTQGRLRCAIYARISKDRTGAGLGVERQEADCRDLATRLGMTVDGVYSDNDLSAFSGKHRPGYEALLKAVRQGEVDAVIVWHQDRLLRRTIDLEKYIDVCQPHTVPTHTVMAGYFDLTTPAGRATAKTLAAWASYEVETSTDRVKASKLQAAKSGKPSGGNRAYGYEQNGMSIIEHEAAIVREVIDRFIGGDSWRSIALDLVERGIPTAKGKKWTAINVRNVAVRPRNISIRVHNENEYPAQWPPLITQDTWDDLQIAIKRGTALYGSRSYTRKHLLKGFVFCGQCGNRMNIISAQDRQGNYQPAFNCRKFDDTRGEVGCGGVKRRQAPVEELVIDCIMYRLDTPELGELIEGTRSATPALKQLMRERDDQAQRLQEILNLYSTGEMTFSEYKTAKTTAQARLDALGRELDKKSSKTTLANIPAGQTVKEAWDKADLMWRRQLVDALIDKVLIDPRIKGQGFPKWRQYRFDCSLIRIEWKA